MKESNQLVLATGDEEFNYPSRLAQEFEEWLKSKELDTINKEFVIVINILELT